MKLVVTGRRVAITLTVLLVAGLGLAWSGLVPIAASAGHSAPVAWFLHWTMGNAVRTQSLGVDTPPSAVLEDPVMVRRGAGHFATSCAPCHGSPAQPRNPVALSMTPHPPPLGDAAHTWQPRELFWIVRHGIKLTGMPAWPAPTRTDEVWGVVAFLRALPDLDAASYLELAGYGGGARPGVTRANTPGRAPVARMPLSEVVRDCRRCHNDERPRAAPWLGGQPAYYLAASLRAFAARERASGVMQAAAGRYDADTLQRVAAHYAAQPMPPKRLQPQQGANAGGRADPLWQRGRAIALRGIRERGVPACTSCHGSQAAKAGDYYPRLLGQPRWYLRRQLELFKNGQRGGTPFHPIMAFIAARLDEQAIAAVVAYYGEGSAAYDAAEADVAALKGM